MLHHLMFIFIDEQDDTFEKGAVKEADFFALLDEFGEHFRFLPWLRSHFLW